MWRERVWLPTQCCWVTKELMIVQGVWSDSKYVTNMKHRKAIMSLLVLVWGAQRIPAYHEWIQEIIVYRILWIQNICQDPYYKFQTLWWRCGKVIKFQQ